MGTSVRPLPSSSSVVREQRGNNNTMAEFGLKKKEVEALDFAFDVYDFKGNGEVDAFYTGDLLRACNLNPTLKTIAEIGGVKTFFHSHSSKLQPFYCHRRICNFDW